MGGRKRWPRDGRAREHACCGCVSLQFSTSRSGARSTCGSECAVTQCGRLGGGGRGAAARPGEPAECAEVGAAAWRARLWCMKMTVPNATSRLLYTSDGERRSSSVHCEVAQRLLERKNGRGSAEAWGAAAGRARTLRECSSEYTGKSWRGRTRERGPVKGAHTHAADADGLQWCTPPGARGVREGAVSHLCSATHAAALSC